MPNTFSYLTGKIKDKIAHRSYERDCKYITEALTPIASAFDRDGLFGSPSNMVVAYKDEDDTSSVNTFSTTATMDDNRGAGLTVDKYFYQPVGRKIEMLAFRIAIPFLSPAKIFHYIEKKHLSTRLTFQDLKSRSGYVNLNSIYLSGLNSLLHQTK